MVPCISYFYVGKIIIAIVAIVFSLQLEEIYNEIDQVRLECS